MLAKPDSIYYTLDDSTLLKTARSDPHGFIQHENELMIIDEIQRAPDLLLAIKKDVDENQAYGRYLLTGSAHIQSTPGVIESLAGRIKKIRLRPLTMGEIHGNPPTFIKNAFAEKFSPIHGTKYNKDDYLKEAILGGFPEPRALHESWERMGWHEDYLRSILEKDLQNIANIQKLDTMLNLVQMLASWSSKYMDISGICQKVNTSRPTVENYIHLLEALFIS